MSTNGKPPEPLTVTVRVLSREYSVACPPEEHEALVASADYVNERMTAIRRRSRALGAERIAVMTALNLARELLALRGEGAAATVDAESLDKLQQMQRDIEQTLGDAD